MITTALVPIDGSPESAQTIPYAQALLPTGGQVVLLHVIPESDHLLPEFLGLLRAMPDEQGICEVARAALDQMVADAQDARLDWQTEVVWGEPAMELLHAVTRFRADAIVMTTHGRGALGRAVFGSVADRITRTSPVPILLVRPVPEATWSHPPMPRRLVVPLDGSPLAKEALPVAIELAERHQLPVHLVRVINVAALLAPLARFGVSGLSPTVYAEVVDSVRHAAELYLAAVAGRLAQSGVMATWTVLEGSPSDCIREAASAEDLMVMTSHGRGGVQRWWMGSVAEKLVREAPSPVLLVPAPDRGSVGHVRDHS